eukprot:COSAG01_NODE_40994_length_457_cov_0.667598_1_plen_108_part_00
MASQCGWCGVCVQVQAKVIDRAWEARREKRWPSQVIGGGLSAPAHALEQQQSAPMEGSGGTKSAVAAAGTVALSAELMQPLPKVRPLGLSCLVARIALQAHPPVFGG